jgi:hypothetical protein
VVDEAISRLMAARILSGACLARAPYREEPSIDCRSPRLTERRRVREARSSLSIRISWRISRRRILKAPHEDAAIVQDLRMSCRPLSKDKNLGGVAAPVSGV